MTCIAGLVDGGDVWIGGDSAGVNTGTYGLTVRADEKVFRNGPMLFGFTSSFRMGQVIRYGLRIPDHDPRAPIEKYMVTTFIDAVRESLKSHGFATKKDDQEAGGTFLVGYRGRLFGVYDDYQVAEASDQVDAVGCGYALAQGALLATPGQPPEARIRKALEIAEHCSAGVRGPFVVLRLEAEPASNAMP